MSSPVYITQTLRVLFATPRIVEMSVRSIMLALCMGVLLMRAEGHMQMLSPPPINSRYNRYSGSDIDYSMTSPLSTDGSNFPCKGYHRLLYDTAGTPVATFRGGESYSMTITGGASHAGGSCQISMSIDGGQTFRVLHTYIGNCPSGMGESSYQFSIPSDIPSRERALLAWTWFNKLGNREMYMNCASVTTVGKGEGNDFDTRPTIFKANIGNGYSTVDSADVMIPNPGPYSTVQNPNAVPPVGNCETGPGGGSGGGSGNPGPPEYSGMPQDPTKPQESHGAGGYPGGKPPYQNWTPGNDWPEGFPDDAATVLIEVVESTVLGLLAFVIAFLFWI